MNDISFHYRIDEDEGTELLTRAFFNGQQCECLIDTGAHTTSIAWNEISAGLKTVGTSKSGTAFGKSHFDNVVLQDFRWGPISRTNLTLQRSQKDQPHARTLIAMDVMGEHCCEFRFDEDRLLVGAQSFEGQALILGKRKHSYTHVQVGQTTGALALFDSGAGLSCVDAQFIKDHPQHFTADGSSIGIDAGGRKMETPLYQMSGLVCGGMAFDTHRVVGLDLSFIKGDIDEPMRMIIGFSTFKQARWTFDYPNKRWAVVPNPVR